ncbi:hypothetical protein DITRI_Ditri20bG0023200 [Diplodiscus trichospermus]
MASTSSTNPVPLKDRVAIVTGSSRGIGQVIATYLAELGPKVIINYTSSSDQANLLATQINSRYPGDCLQAVTVKVGVFDPTQFKFLFDSAKQAFGSPIHVLDNSAEVFDPKYSKIFDTSLEDFYRIFKY